MSRVEHTPKHPIAVLISGRGSNMVALANACRQPAYPARINVVIANTPHAAGLEKAQQLELATAVAPTEAEIDRTCRAYGAKLICCAGFNRILSATFVQNWQSRILNIHPSLLPKFPGQHAQAQALASGDSETGCTVHYVDEGVDTGPIIAQATAPILADDSLEELSQRILEVEHQLYPTALRQVCEEHLHE